MASFPFQSPLVVSRRVFNSQIVYSQPLSGKRVAIVKLPVMTAESRSEELYKIVIISTPELPDLSLAGAESTRPNFPA